MKRNILFLLIILVVIACKKEQETATLEPEIPAKTFTVTFENVMQDYTFFQAGTTDLIQPGESKSYPFVAGVGAHLSFATMLVESNDLFYGFEGYGFALYNDRRIPINGEITYAVRLWDAGTEVNEVLGEGSSQAPRQAEVNFGEREDGVIQLVDSLEDDLVYPVTDRMIRMSLKVEGDSKFVLIIENISQDAPMSSALAPGVFTIHQPNKYLFKAEEKASESIEKMAEDGDNSNLWNEVTEKTGFTSTVGTGIYVVHKVANPIFTNGEKDRGEGLEVLAESGNPEKLYDALKENAAFSEVNIFNNPIGSNVLNLGGKLVVGDRYEFSFQASQGDYLSIANMLVETNDLFFAFDEGGLELFPNGQPINGEITNQIRLWDAGTEANQFPGAGSFQPGRNGGKESTDEGGVVRLLDDEFSYPVIDELIRVSIKEE